MGTSRQRLLPAKSASNKVKCFLRPAVIGSGEPRRNSSTRRRSLQRHDGGPAILPIAVPVHLALGVAHIDLPAPPKLGAGLLRGRLGTAFSQRADEPWQSRADPRRGIRCALRPPRNDGRARRPGGEARSGGCTTIVRPQLVAGARLWRAAEPAFPCGSAQRSLRSAGAAGTARLDAVWAARKTAPSRLSGRRSLRPSDGGQQ